MNAATAAARQAAAERTLLNKLKLSATDFAPFVRAEDGFWNVTQLCKAAGKEWKHWIETKNHRAMVDEVRRIVDPPILQVTTGPNNLRGTWACPEVAIHVAMWLSPRFAVWVTQLVMRYARGDLTLAADVIERHDQLNDTVTTTVLASESVAASSSSSSSSAPTPSSSESAVQKNHQEDDDDDIEEVQGQAVNHDADDDEDQASEPALHYHHHKVPLEHVHHQEADDARQRALRKRQSTLDHLLVKRQVLALEHVNAMNDWADEFSAPNADAMSKQVARDYKRTQLLEHTAELTKRGLYAEDFLIANGYSAEGAHRFASAFGRCVLRELKARDMEPPGETTRLVQGAHRAVNQYWVEDHMQLFQDVFVQFKRKHPLE